MNELTNKLSALLKSDLSSQCSSAAYAIMIDDEIVAEDSMGRNPIRGGTYNVGSISKVYCAVAVMQLVEKGLVDLDTPVCKYLPRFHMPDERYKQITLRHCLSHSCGLPGTQWRWLAAGSPRQDYYDEVYRFMERSALHSDPGEFSVYCNDGFTLAEMVVSEITGMEYGEYCMKYITEPIGAHSSRQSSRRNPDYQHTFIVGMPPESIGPEGAGGIGTTMPDLCKFGRLFLNENEVFSQTSKNEIDKPQGTTFLPNDGYSAEYGLGWDSVDMPHSKYSLGCGVLDKGGGTVQFSSRLMVIPKYNAVLAISATYDCGIDVKEELLQMFAAAMLERGVNIWTDAQPLSDDEQKCFEGLYLADAKFYRVNFNGPRLDIHAVDSRGNESRLYANLLYDGEGFVWKSGYRLFFYQHDGKRYLMVSVHGRSFALGVKAEDCHCESFGESWKNRIGKQYIIANVFYDDIVGSSLYNGFKLNLLPDLPNLLVASFSNENRKKPEPFFEVPLTPYINGKYSEQLACGAIKLPYHAGRDLLNLFFEEKDGIEYCESSGYLYKDISSLEEYNGQAFQSAGALNQIYAVTSKLENKPHIPDGRRMLLFNEDLCVVYDSLLDSEFKSIEKGYISLI